MSEVKLKHSSGNSTGLAAPAANPSSDVTLKVPSTTGSAGQYLKVASANHSSTNAELEWATVSAGADLTPAFHATQSGNQTVANGTTKIALNSETFDTDSAFDHSTNYRFTVPSGEGGKYWFAYCIRFGYGLDDNEIIQGQLFKNGSDEPLTQSMFRSPSGSGYNPSAVNCSGILTLSASDYIELYVYHNEGGDMATSAGSTFLAMYKLQGV